MKLSLPKSDQHGAVRVSVKSPKGLISESTFDSSHDWFEYEAPKGVSEDELEVISEFLNNAGQPDGSPCVLKSAVVRKAPAPAPKVEPKPEPKVEPKAEAKVEDKAE
jgi:hypothetical protein